MDSGNMATIARPYAAAAFEFALAKKSLPAWETMLQSAATMTADANMQRLLNSPGNTAKQLANLYCDLLGKLDTQQKHFICLLAENARLPVIPAIATLFAEARAQQEKMIAVQVISATSLEDKYRQKLQQALTRRLQRHVELAYEVDPNLLGGVVVRAGDVVIDGSIRGKLTRLNEFI